MALRWGLATLLVAAMLAFACLSYVDLERHGLKVSWSSSWTPVPVAPEAGSAEALFVGTYQTTKRMTWGQLKMHLQLTEDEIALAFECTTDQPRRSYESIKEELIDPSRTVLVPFTLDACERKAPLSKR